MSLPAAGRWQKGPERYPANPKESHRRSPPFLMASKGGVPRLVIRGAHVVDVFLMVLMVGAIALLFALVGWLGRV
jgi:hypothetical protein